MVTTSDDALAAAGEAFTAYARSGDRAALEPVLGPCVHAALIQARRLLGNQQDAADATQEALLQAMGSAGRYDPARPFAPWFAVIVHRSCGHLLRSQMRSRRRDHAVAYTPGAMTAAEGSLDADDAELVRAAVSELREPEREAVSLHYFGGLSQDQVAEVLHVTPNAVAVRLHRARERLRMGLSRRGYAGTTSDIAIGLAAAPSTLSPAVAQQVLGQLARSAPSPPPSILHGALHPLRSAVHACLRHPLLTGWCCGAVVLGIALSIALTPSTSSHEALPAGIVAGVLTSPASAPAPAAPWWNGATLADLHALDPQASLQAAVDLDAMRQLGARTRPTTVFADPEAQAWVVRIKQLLHQAGPDGVWQLLAGGHRLVVSQHDDAAGAATQSSPMPERGLYLINAPTAVLDLWAQRQQGPATPVTWGPWQVDQRNQRLWQGRSQDHLVVGQPGLVRWLAQGGNPGVVRAGDRAVPAWLRFDGGALLDAYDRIGVQDQDPGGIEDLIGPRWRELVRSARGHVRIQAQILPVDGSWTGKVSITGLHPFPITLLLAGVSQAQPWINDLGFVRGRPCRSDLAALVPVHYLASLVLGLDGLATPAISDIPLSSVDGSSNPAAMRAVRALIAAWSGDLACWITEAPGVPQASVVLGLRHGVDGVAAFAALAKALGASRCDPVQGTLASAIGFCPLGQFTWMRTGDRLIFTTQSSAEFMSSSTRTSTARAGAGIHQLELAVDTPRCLPWMYGLCALAEVSSNDLPPQAVLRRHLVPWTLCADDAPDAVALHESGLPLATLLIAAACAHTAGEVHPADDIAQSRTAEGVRLTINAARAQVCALYRIGHQLGTVAHPDSTHNTIDFRNFMPCASLSAWCDEHHVDLAELSPLADGSAPLPEQADHLGSWWSQVPSIQVWVIEDQAAETISAMTVTSGSGGFNVWLQPVAGRPGWWLGLVDGVPVLTDQPPKAKIQPAAQHAFN